MSTPAGARGANSRATFWLCALLIVFGAWRALMMLSAEPMVALANNYDQVRYTACFDIYPLRPGADPTALNYRAPLETYAFQPIPGAPCYRTSDLLFQGAASAWFQWRESRGAVPGHSVRVLGVLRGIAWLLAVLLVCRAFWREGRGAYALANAAWFALLALDPVNSIYLNTFYAEPGVLYFLYLCICLSVLACLRGTALRLGLLLLASIALATSKQQHMALPLFIGLAVASVAWLRARALWPVALTLLLGGATGLSLQLMQMQRGGPLFTSIGLVNNTNLALSAVLPASSDPARTASRLGLGDACLEHIGKNIYTVKLPPETACPGVAALSRGRVLGLLLSEPATILRMLSRVPSRMLPWIPDYLGVVANPDVDAAPQSLPARFVSLDRLLATRALWAWILLLTPLCTWILLLLRRAAPAPLTFAAACSAVCVTVPCVTVFGDGFTETAKQAHLALNAACALCLVGVVVLFAQRFLRRR